MQDLLECWTKTWFAELDDGIRSLPSSHHIPLACHADAQGTLLHLYSNAPGLPSNYLVIRPTRLLLRRKMLSYIAACSHPRLSNTGALSQPSGGSCRGMRTGWMTQDLSRRM